MKRGILTAVAAGAAVVVLSSVGAAVATTAPAPHDTTSTSTTTTLAPPVQGAGKHQLFFYVDTVQGSGGVPKAAVGCAQTSQFIVGQVVVFRMYGIHVAFDGYALTPDNVKSAVVNVPGLPQPLQMTYASHGKISFWTAPWFTAGYPNLGTVNFNVTVTTKAIAKSVHHPAYPAMSGTFTQAGMAAPSMLTLNPAPTTTTVAPTTTTSLT